MTTPTTPTTAAPQVRATLPPLGAPAADPAALGAAVTAAVTAAMGPVVARLDALAAQVSYLAERQRAQEELFAEMTPIAREAMSVAIARLDDLDKRGVFAFAGALAGVGGRIVEGFSPADVRQLGDAVVGILETVRAMTQPEVLAIAADASAAMHDADAVKPLGLFGMVRATKNDDVQKGMALMLEVLRRVGKGVNAVATSREQQLAQKDKLAALLGPRRGKALGTERQLPPAEQAKVQAKAAAKASPPPVPAAAKAAPAAAKAPACAVPAGPVATAAVIDGVAYSADGHLVDASAWTPELGKAIAELSGVTLTDAHWHVIDLARADFAATKASPNIRRLTQISHVGTKDLYTLFPKAPGRTIAKIAGLPKPAGCL